MAWSDIAANEMQEARRRQKELEQVERQNAAAATVGPGSQATPHFAVPVARPHSARSARFAEGMLGLTAWLAPRCLLLSFGSQELCSTVG